MYALIDGNSFYCSCERAFDPALRDRPVVVLSNNDGCAIARTQEAKDLGIKMGEPYHLARHRAGLEHVVWKSSNYALYGDMSRRMFEVLTPHAPRIEPYSIDEMFLDCHGLDDLSRRASDMRAAVMKATKIPTCVGIGPTKTIAKLANAIAKQRRLGDGVCDLSAAVVRRNHYRELGVDEVWGIGPAATRKLHQMGAQTIADLVALPDDAIRERLTVVGLRTCWELRGISCLALSQVPATRKSIAVTRSFGAPILLWGDMEQAIASYASRAAVKLRRHGLVACAMQVFVHTNRFSKTDAQYARQTSFAIEPSADSFALIAAATRAARRIWSDGYRYAKAGVILLDLSRDQDRTMALFSSADPIRSAELMRALDAINQRYGRGTIRPGLVASSPPWGMRQANLSPSYTTNIDEILAARA